MALRNKSLVLIAFTAAVAFSCSRKNDCDLHVKSPEGIHSTHEIDYGYYVKTTFSVLQNESDLEKYCYDSVQLANKIKTAEKIDFSTQSVFTSYEPPCQSYNRTVITNHDEKRVTYYLYVVDCDRHNSECWGDYNFMLTVVPAIPPGYTAEIIKNW